MNFELTLEEYKKYLNETHMAFGEYILNLKNVVNNQLCSSDGRVLESRPTSYGELFNEWNRLRIENKTKMSEKGYGSKKSNECFEKHKQKCDYQDMTGICCICDNDGNEFCDECEQYSKNI